MSLRSPLLRRAAQMEAVESLMLERTLAMGRDRHEAEGAEGLWVA